MNRCVLTIVSASGLLMVANAAERKAICRLPNSEKLIALTFDDGPSAEYTRPILAILERHEVKATFFQVGEKMQALPVTSRLVTNQGHEIGNHSMTHAKLPELDSHEAVMAEIHGFQELAKATIGKAPKVFRAPYLKFDDRVWAVLDELDLPAFNASVYADYKGDGDLTDPAVASAHADAVVAKVKKGTIILMHEREITLHYLDELVGKLKEAGFSFVTTSDLLTEDD